MGERGKGKRKKGKKRKEEEVRQERGKRRRERVKRRGRKERTGKGWEEMEEKKGETTACFVYDVLYVHVKYLHVSRSVCWRIRSTTCTGIRTFK